MVKILGYQLKHQQEIKKYQEDLDDLRLYIQDFTAFLPIAVCAITPIQVIIDINAAFEKLTGFKALEIIGKPWNELFLGEREIEKIKEKISQKTFIESQELILVTKEKKQIPVSISISIRKDEEENLSGYFLSITDLTTLKKFQESEIIRTKERLAILNILEDIENEKEIAQEEKNKLQAIVFNLSDGLLFFNNENILKIFNPQVEIYFEVKEREVLNKKISALSGFYKLNFLLEFLRNQPERIFREELKIEENLILEITSFPVSIETGTLGKLVILHDITREKQIEKTKSEFVSIAAHQLRTPLSGIKWTLQMLLSNDLGEITSEQRDFIEKGNKANERVITIINDLLNVTKIEEGRHLYKLTLINIEDVLQEIITLLQEVAQKKKIKLEFKALKEKLPQVEIDVEKIKIAFQNLIENAIHYTFENGLVTISLEYVKNEIEGIKFQVKDTGIGIAKNQQQRLFTKFFRSPKAITMETDGSGLGLFITKNIIEAHKGKIGFESEEGKGSTFWFILPILKQ